MSPGCTRSADSDQACPSEGAPSLELLHQQLTDAIATIETGAQWHSWLDFARRLHRYSFNNVVLIWAQRPDATAVASYASWQAMNRQVRRGEKALRVMAPILRRTPVLDEGGQPVLGSDGRATQRQQITGFRPVPVFDIAQTEGPLPPQPPRPVLLAGQAPAGLWQALANDVSQRGYRLMRGSVEQLNGANGVTRIAEREVWVRDDVNEAQAVKTLTHELAHIMLHTQAEASIGCVGIREVEAESVAHLVLAVHGVDTATFSFPYVATWAHPLAAVEHVSMTDIVRRTGTRVMQAAAGIIDVTASVLEPSADPSTAAQAARITAATEQTVELRERAEVSLLPAVEQATLLGVIADSQDYFRRQVGQSWVVGYLTERRLDAAVHSHALGHAPKSWTAVTDHLRKLGYTDDHIEAAGMATRARNNHLIDRFRDRLTIPLRNSDGELVGFTARSRPDSEDGTGPKYLNSPTTAIFRKSDVLYAQDDYDAKLASGATPVICEGPLDAMAVDLIAAKRGLPLVGLAAIGTAFTKEHTQRLLAIVTERPICLAFDADSAGQAATKGAWRRLTDHAPHDVRVAELPNGADPASLLSTNSDGLAQVLVGARPAATVITERQIDAAGLDGHAGRELAAFRSLSQLSGRVPTDHRPQYLLDLARRLDIDPADAATIAVEQNPKLLMEQIAQRTHRMNDPVSDALVDRFAMDSGDQRSSHDHQVIRANSR